MGPLFIRCLFFSPRHVLHLGGAVLATPAAPMPQAAIQKTEPLGDSVSSSPTRIPVFSLTLNLRLSTVNFLPQKNERPVGGPAARAWGMEGLAT
jgi:hypothetical protein